MIIGDNRQMLQYYTVKSGLRISNYSESNNCKYIDTTVVNENNIIVKVINGILSLPKNFLETIRKNLFICKKHFNLFVIRLSNSFKYDYLHIILERINSKNDLESILFNKGLIFLKTHWIVKRKKYMPYDFS